MTARTVLPFAALALLLSACLPDLPPSTGTVEVTVEPAAAAGVSFDWEIRGTDMSGNEHEYSGTCGADCSTFSQQVRISPDWELRVSPPELNPNTLEMGWVAAGPAHEQGSPDFVMEFAVLPDQTTALTATFRRPHIVQWDFEAPVNAAGTVRLTGLRSQDGSAGFTVSELTAECTTQGGTARLNFGLPAGSELAISDSAQDVELVYLDDPTDTPLFGDTTVCSLAGVDAEGRPLGFRHTN